MFSFEHHPQFHEEKLLEVIKAIHIYPQAICGQRIAVNRGEEFKVSAYSLHTVYIQFNYTLEVLFHVNYLCCVRYAKWRP
jgi:hypothetical protein